MKYLVIEFGWGEQEVKGIYDSAEAARQDIDKYSTNPMCCEVFPIEDNTWHERDWVLRAVVLD